MARSIQEQCHQYLISQEENRCLAEESERRAKDGSNAKPVKRRGIPPPTIRPGPQGLCQDHEFLLMVTEFDYKLDRGDFQRYCSDRGILFLAGDPGGPRWRYFQGQTTTWGEFSTDPALQIAQKVEGKDGLRFSLDDLRFQWQVVTIGRARLQDAWELFLQEKRA